MNKSIKVKKKRLVQLINNNFSTVTSIKYNINLFYSLKSHHITKVRPNIRFIKLVMVFII